jgi:metallo-beta-lactamase class B
MSHRVFSNALPCLLLGTAALATIGPDVALSGEPPRETVTASRLPQTPQSTAHIEAAKALANGDAELTRTWSFFCTPTNYNAPGPELEPMKVFDNLYMIPSSTRQQTTAWAITTREGIILIDSGEQGQPDAILAGLQKVGLDPAQVKAILLGHGHGDHYAGALYFQERYGTRVGADAKDWDLMYPATPPANAPPAQGTPAPKPKRDLVLEAGKPFVLGEQTVHVYSIPGHTPGSLGFIFNVTENARTHTAAIFGGTILDQGRIPTDGLNQYLASIKHFQDGARKMNVDVEIQNHALFDSTPERAAKLKARKPGEPNPFLMTTDKYVRLWDIAAECIRAEIARR